MAEITDPDPERRPRADDLKATSEPDEALLQWVRELAAGASTYRGLPAAMLTTLNDPGSALWTACAAVREAGARLLVRAQRAGRIRDDVTDGDVLALVGAVAWIADQGAPVADRQGRALAVLLDGLRPHPATSRQEPRTASPGVTADGFAAPVVGSDADQAAETDVRADS